jgi:hypothetical protein
MAALVRYLQVDLLSLTSSVAWKLLLLDSHLTGELSSYCIVPMVLHSLSRNLAGDPALLIKMGQMLFISHQVVFGSSMLVVVNSTTWNLKGNLSCWSSKLQSTRSSKD